MAYAKNKLEPMSAEALFPAEVEDGEEAEPLLVDVDVEVEVPVDLVPEPELVLETDPVALELDPLEVADGNRLAGSVTLAQERSYNGCVPKVLSLVLLPRRPKLGTGVVGAASWRTYHQVLTLPNADAHPISSQNVFALAKLGTPRFSVFPLMGHPVSVIHTGLPPAAPAVALYAAQKRS
jgi:hypothetical protein